MTKSIPCAKCAQVDDLETINPLGIHMDKAQELVRKAMVMDEMRD